VLGRRTGVRSRLAAAKPRARWRAIDDPAPSGGRESDDREEARVGVAEAKADAAQQGRQHSSREGVLASVKRPSFTRRRWRWCLAVSQRRFARAANRLARSRDRGRQRLRRKTGSRLKTPRPGGAARRSVRSKLRQDRVASRPPPQSGRTESAGWQRVVTRPKLEVRRQAKLHLGAHRGHWPKGEPASVAAQKAREGRSVTRGSPGNWAVFGVLGSWIGCRSRTSASFSCGAARCGATRGET